MVAPIIWGLIALGMACAGAKEEERPVQYPEAYPNDENRFRFELLPRRPDPNDPCPGQDYCSCAEGTGWVPGMPVKVGDHFVRIGNRTIDTKKELYTVKQRFSRTTIVYNTDFEFKLGTAEPKDPALFKRQTSDLIENVLLKLVTKQYSCAADRYSNDPIVYVSGHTDRMGDDAFNLKLSQDRALAVAREVKKWLEGHHNLLKQPVPIQYVGRGEEEAGDNGDADGTPNEKQRRVDVLALTDGPPFQANWQVLGTIQPSGVEPITLPVTPRPIPYSPPVTRSPWRNFAGAAVQKEIDKRCQSKGSNAQICADRVGGRIIQAAEAVCKKEAGWDGVSPEECRNSLLSFVWKNVSQLKSKYSDTMPTVVHSIEKGDGFHQSLKTFIEQESAL